MAEIFVPYGDASVKVGIPDRNLLGVLVPRTVPRTADSVTLIERSLANPIGSPLLREAASRKGAKSACILITDVTRPSPDRLFLPPLVRELVAAGIRQDAIRILIANGMHRPCTPGEMEARVGREICGKFPLLNHEASSSPSLSYVGKTDRGCPVWINTQVLQSDLVVSTGVIEPHLFAGYSGGRKSVAIGAAGQESIRFQHRPQVLHHPQTRIGHIRGNIFHENATQIARMAGLHFIVNAVLNTEGEVVKVVCGDMEEAFEEGVSWAREIFEADIEEQADIVITGVRPPKDANLFQATRGASYVAFSPYPSVKKGGTIVVPALTPEGAGKGPGEKTYYKITSEAKDLDDIMEEVRNRPVPAGGHRAYVMAMTLKHANVAVAGSATPEEVRRLFLSSFSSTDEAVQAALSRHGKDARVYVIPDSLHLFTTRR